MTALGCYRTVGWRPSCWGLSVKEHLDEVFASDSPEFALDVSSLFGFIPEEELPLRQLVAWCLGTVDGFKRVGIVARIPCLSGNGHGCRCEVLYLFQVEVHLLRQHRQLSHVFFAASWMATNEIRYELLAKILFSVDAVEGALELFEEPERRFSHQLQHAVGGVFGCHFQSSADMAGNQFSGIFACSLVHLLVVRMVQEQVIAYTAANETLLDFRQGIYGMVDVE